ncbi:hypothetical protein ACFTWF_38320 [Rhodococcus sp. NPDC056960]|uniref:hypothetical protein n=1 Tax=Rhodococcus sp. NPDC056960 TaxID=3345982 RepID=UPI00363301D9
MSTRSTTVPTPDRTGAFVRRRVPCGHRTGQWAQILATTATGARAHFLVIYPDGETDMLPVEATGQHYQFGPAPTSWNR